MTLTQRMRPRAPSPPEPSGCNGLIWIVKRENNQLVNTNVSSSRTTLRHTAYIKGKYMTSTMTLNQ
jgi:hypothetical protein